MKKIKLAAFAMSLLTIVSCSTNAGTGALIGTGGGAALGALAGRLIGGNTKGTVIGAAAGAAIGATAGSLIGKHMDKVKAQAAAQLANATVEGTTDSNGLSAVKVTFDNGILFPVGKYALQQTAKNELSNFATVLKGNTDCSVSINGFASSDGSEATNLTLSQNRADAVKSYLTSCGVPASQIQGSTGYGETNLILDANGKEDVKASRRVEVYLYASEAMIAAANAGTLQ